MKEQFLTLSGWMIPFSKAMNLYGINVNEVMRNCDINFTAIKNQESWVSAEKFAQIINYCIQHSGRIDFPLIIAKQFHPGTFNALGYAMMSSNCLKDALARISQYKRVVSNTCSLILKEDGEQLVLDMSVFTYEDTGRAVLSHELILTFLATLLEFSKRLVGAHLKPKKLMLSISKPAHDLKYLHDFFECEIEFSCVKPGIIFDLSESKLELLSSNPLMTQVHEKMLDELLVRIDKDDLVHSVRNEIYHMLPLGAPTQSEVAKQLCMSLRNLQRKLNEQNTSYKEILEHSRKKLSIEYMKQPHLSLSEIGYLVGFATVANFNRAFKRWTNFSPGKYRTENRHL